MLKGMSIQDIFEDSNGFIWISTFLDGLYRFNPATKDWKIFVHDISDPGSLPYNKTTAVYEDSKRRLWVATQGGGFGLFDRENETFSTLTVLMGYRTMWFTRLWTITRVTSGYPPIQDWYGLILRKEHSKTIRSTMG